MLHAHPAFSSRTFFAPSASLIVRAQLHLRCALAACQLPGKCAVVCAVRASPSPCSFRPLSLCGLCTRSPGCSYTNMSLLQPFPLVVRSSASATDRVAVELPPFSVVCANQTMCLFGLEVGPRRQLHSVSLCDALPLERSLSMIPHGPRRTSTVVHRV